MIINYMKGKDTVRSSGMEFRPSRGWRSEAGEDNNNRTKRPLIPKSNSVSETWKAEAWPMEDECFSTSVRKKGAQDMQASHETLTRGVAFFLATLNSAPSVSWEVVVCGKCWGNSY